MRQEWDKMIPRSESKFYLVECSSCGNAQIVFSHASRQIRCNVCKKVLVKPTGGKAMIDGKIIRVFGGYG